MRHEMLGSRTCLTGTTTPPSEPQMREAARTSFALCNVKVDSLWHQHVLLQIVEHLHVLSCVLRRRCAGVVERICETLLWQNVKVISSPSAPVELQFHDSHPHKIHRQQLHSTKQHQRWLQTTPPRGNSQVRVRSNLPVHSTPQDSCRTLLLPQDSCQDKDATRFHHRSQKQQMPTRLVRVINALPRYCSSLHEA
jgi:hypothetical protein